MKENGFEIKQSLSPSPRELAQKKFNDSGKDGFVEDFVDEGSDDLRFSAMSPDDQELWIDIVDIDTSLIEDPPFFEPGEKKDRTD